MLRDAGLRVVITVAPLLPIDRPEEFFSRLRDVANAVVIDHYIAGDGSREGNGSRTLRTPLPQAMAGVDPSSVTIAYRDRMVEIAVRHFGASAVGVNIDGFAGRMLDRRVCDGRKDRLPVTGAGPGC
jgi:hypothetical protein